MNWPSQIEKRWHFVPPTLYLDMYTAGLVDPASEKCLRLSDTRWLTLERIANDEPPPYMMGGLVPFARQIGGDQWCWMRDHATGVGVPVTLSPRDSNTATVYAPHFAGCVYRLLLEELSSTWLVQGDQTADRVSSMFRSYARDLIPFLPAAWAATLKELSERPLLPVAKGTDACLTREEANAILRRDLAFPLLDLEFLQDVSAPLEPGLSGFKKTVDFFADALTPEQALAAFDRTALRLTRCDRSTETRKAFETLLIARPEDGVEVPIKVHFYPQTSYNRAELRATGLTAPARIVLTVPLEAKAFLADILRQTPLSSWFIATHAGLVRLSAFLNTGGNWNDL